MQSSTCPSTTEHHRMFTPQFCSFHRDKLSMVRQTRTSALSSRLQLPAATRVQQHYSTVQALWLHQSETPRSAPISQVPRPLAFQWSREKAETGNKGESKFFLFEKHGTRHYHATLTGILKFTVKVAVIILLSIGTASPNIIHPAAALNFGSPTS